MYSSSPRYGLRHTPERSGLRPRNGSVGSYNLRRTPRRESSSDSASPYDFRKRFPPSPKASKYRRSRVSKYSVSPAIIDSRGIGDLLTEVFAKETGSRPTIRRRTYSGRSEETNAEVENIIAGITGMHGHASPQLATSVVPLVELTITAPIDACADAGEALFESTMDDILATHAAFRKDISQHADLCNKVVKRYDRQHDHLEDRIGRSLAQTRVWDRFRHRATVEQHLDIVARQLRDAETKLDTLEERWKACYQAEANAWDALVNGSPAQEAEDRDFASAVQRDKDAFKKEARAIATKHCRSLKKMDEVSPAWLHAQRQLTLCRSIRGPPKSSGSE